MIAAMVTLGLVVLFTVALVRAARTRLERVLRRHPIRRIAEVPEGSVARVVGTVAYAGAPLVSPVAANACALFRASVRGEGFSIAESAESAEGDFLLRDGTGKAVVRVHAAQVALVFDTHLSFNALEEVPFALEVMLERHGHSSKGLLFNRPVTFREAVLAEGAEVCVVGRATWEPAPHPDADAIAGLYREAPRRLVFRAASRAPLYVCNEPEVLR